MRMRNRREAAAKLGLFTILVLAWATQSGAVPITTFNSAYQFRWNIGPNSVGLPQGDQQYVGILNVSPIAGTAVTATQGAVTRPLPFTPFTAFPTQFRSLQPFDPTLTGGWWITALNGADGAGPILAAPIATPQLVPLATNLQIVGSGATPTVTWSLPDLTGINVSVLRFRVHDDATDDTLLGISLPVSTTSFAIPVGLLAPGVSYIFQVNLDGGENVSSAFTQTPYVVPEPGTAVLFGLGLAGLVGVGRGRCGASERTGDRGRA